MRANPRSTLVVVFSVGILGCGGRPVADGGPAVDLASLPDGGASIGIDRAPPAKALASVTFDRGLRATVPAGSTVLALHADHDYSVVDVRDPTRPQIFGPFPTDGPIAAVHYDEHDGLALVAEKHGKLRVANLLNPALAGTVAQVDLGQPIELVARVGAHALVVSGTSAIPIGVDRLDNGTVALSPGGAQPLPDTPMQLAAGGGNFYFGYSSGRVEVRSPVGALLGQIELGAPLSAMVARGSIAIALVQGMGMRVIEFRAPATPTVRYAEGELGDATSAQLVGSTLVVSLSRGAVSGLDVSRLDAPRAVTTNPAALPPFFAIAGGGLLLGTGATSATIAAIPPFAIGLPPAATLQSFPPLGELPVTFSKAIDPATVTAANVSLTCAGTAVGGTPIALPDGLGFLFLPGAPLPPNASCALSYPGVADRLGIAESAAPGAATLVFTTGAALAAVSHPASAIAHTTDGNFSGWAPGSQANEKYEWSDVPPFKGVYSFFYADFDGATLRLLNDWFDAAENIDPDAFDLFDVTTGNGSQRWAVRVYGDGHVEAWLNGALIDSKALGVLGGAAFGPSPNWPSAHTTWEIALPAAAGAWGVQLHGPNSASQRLDSEPTPILGSLSGAQGTAVTTIDLPIYLSAPAAPTVVWPMDGAAEVSLGPTLKWSTSDPWNALVSGWVEVSSAVSFAAPLYGALASGGTIDLPPGLLAPGTQYHWRVVAGNAGGTTVGSGATFTTAGGVTPDGGVDAGADDLATLEASAPDMATADLAIPDSATPDLAAPDLATPDLATPDLATPDLATSRDGATDAAPPDGAIPVWSATPTNGGSGGAAIWGSGPNDVYVVGSTKLGAAFVVHSTDGGKSWLDQSKGIAVAGPLYAVWGSGPGDVYAGYNHTSDGGKSWQSSPANGFPIFSTGPMALWGTSASNVYAAGWGSVNDMGACLYHTTDGGKTWNDESLALFPNDSAQFSALWGSSANDVYVGGAYPSGTTASIYRSIDGKRWSKVYDAGFAYEIVYGIWGSGPNDVYAVGSGGLIVHSGDQGKSWQVQKSGTNIDLRAVWGSGPGDVYVTGVPTTLLHSADGGATWAAVTVPKEQYGFGGVWGSAANDVYVLGGDTLHLH